MKVLVTALARPRDQLTVFFPGRPYDVDPAIAQRLIDADCAEEMNKSSLEKKNKDQLAALAVNVGAELDGSESKSQLVSKIVDDAPEAEAPQAPATPPPPGGGQQRQAGGVGAT
jgi:hypothetical protein